MKRKEEKEEQKKGKHKAQANSDSRLEKAVQRLTFLTDGPLVLLPQIVRVSSIATDSESTSNTKQNK